LSGDEPKEFYQENTILRYGQEMPKIRISWWDRFTRTLIDLQVAIKKPEFLQKTIR